MSSHLPVSPDEIRADLDPVMLEFGAAIFTCQGFEWNLCMLLALLESHFKGDRRGEALPSHIEFHSKKTLGALVDLLKRIAPLPADFDQSLENGRRLRNKLVHGYLVGDNTMRLVNPAERLKLIAEIKAHRETINSIGNEVGAIVTLLFEQFGVPKEMIAEVGDMAWRQFNPDPAKATRQ